MVGSSRVCSGSCTVFDGPGMECVAARKPGEEGRAWVREALESRSGTFPVCGRKTAYPRGSELGLSAQPLCSSFQFCVSW